MSGAHEGSWGLSVILVNGKALNFWYLTEEEAVTAARDIRTGQRVRLKSTETHIQVQEHQIAATVVAPTKEKESPFNELDLAFIDTSAGAEA